RLADISVTTGRRQNGNAGLTAHGILPEQRMPGVSACLLRRGHMHHNGQCCKSAHRFFGAS
ncbi:hypothetical protein ABTE52_23025, partial [Acinetobacter baumannii]